MSASVIARRPRGRRSNLCGKDCFPPQSVGGQAATLAMTDAGFLLVEVLMAILILAIAFVAFMGAMAQSMKVSYKSSQTTEAISRYEAFLFEIENGLRPDLAGYGGQGDLEGDYRYQIQAESGGEFGTLLKGRFSWKGGREFLEHEVFVSKAPAQ